MAGVALLATAHVAVAVADGSVQTSGSIVYAWQGDPARGCAQVGVCGVHGTLVLQPLDGAELIMDTPSQGDLLLNNVSAIERVQGGDLENGGTCVDQGQEGGGDLMLSLKPHGVVTGSFGDTLTSGRCAGPVAQELAAVPIRGRRSTGARPSWDLSESVPYAAGPFTGTLVSTLVLTPGHSSSSSSSSSSSGSFFGGGGSPSSSKPHKVLVEEVDLFYRFRTAPGALGFSFRGDPGPFCAALESCGATGSATLGFPSFFGLFPVTASRVVSAPVSRRQALKDFRAGKLHFGLELPVAGPPVQLSELFEDAGKCTDEVPAGALVIGLGPLFGPNAALPLTVNLGDVGEDELLRTHCPGPEATDVYGTSQLLTSLRIPRRRLLARHWTFALSSRGVFGVPGYVGARNGQLDVSMSLLSVTAGTRVEESQ